MRPRVAFVAGSGIDLSALLDRAGSEIGFGEVNGLETAGVAGHAGRFRLGYNGDTPIVLQEGRLHLYEGHDYASATRTVDALADFGVEHIIFTNAAGGLCSDMQAGHLMAATRLLGWPYARWPERPETLSLGHVIPGCDSSGDYLWVHGPCYETPAEIRAMQHVGADAVGMSTLPEAVRCAELGIACAAISCITNNCCTPQYLTHEHVIASARKTSQRLTRILRDALREFARV
jgi:purine-nucleoside phosphorylase